MISSTFVTALIALSLPAALATGVKYIFEPGIDFSAPGTCGWTQGCGSDPYGGCAYAIRPESPISWCCPAGDNACWGWRQDCKATGGQKKCVSGKNTWCCDAEYEDCVYADGKINLCTLKTSLFPNPQGDYPTDKKYGDGLPGVTTTASPNSPTETLSSVESTFTATSMKRTSTKTSSKPVSASEEPSTSPTDTAKNAPSSTLEPKITTTDANTSPSTSASASASASTSATNGGNSVRAGAMAGSGLLAGLLLLAW